MKEIKTTRHAVEQLCRRFYKDDAIEVSKYKLVGDYMIKAFSEEHLADMVRRNISD